MPHRKKRFTSFPSKAGMSLTKVLLARNNSVMTSLFPPRESLVVTSRWGRETREPFFYGADTVNDCFIMQNEIRIPRLLVLEYTVRRISYSRTSQTKDKILECMIPRNESAWYSSIGCQ